MAFSSILPPFRSDRRKFKEVASEAEPVEALRARESHPGIAGTCRTDNHLEELKMKQFVLSVMLSAFALTAAAGEATCTITATEKNLAGAAKSSFLKKCEKDAKAACDTSASEKKLAGAAKSSFVKKCVKDAVGG